jgi:hypothetical protein
VYAKCRFLAFPPCRASRGIDSGRRNNSPGAWAGMGRRVVYAIPGKTVRGVSWCWGAGSAGRVSCRGRLSPRRAPCRVVSLCEGGGVSAFALPVHWQRFDGSRS